MNAKLGIFNSTPTPFEIECALEGDDILQCKFHVKGPTSEILFPHPSLKPGFRDFLWEHTCFELFASPSEPDSRQYFEWNFSPSGDWAVYSFESYRKADRSFQSLSHYFPQFIRHSPQHVELEVALPLAEVIPAHWRKIQLGICCILELKDRTKNFWALTHSSSKPDFHQKESFTLFFDRSRN